MSIDSMGVFSDVRESLLYLFAAVIGERDETPPYLPDGLPEAVVPIASDGIHLLIEYQGTAYAKLYVDRLRRFVRKRGVDETMLGGIARLMAMRMSYQDPIRIAQQKLIELEIDPDTPRADDIRKFRLDELIDVLPAVVAGPILDTLGWLGWVPKRGSIHFYKKRPRRICPLQNRGSVRGRRP